MDNVSIVVSIGYDGTDTWDVTGSVNQSGDTVSSVEAHLHEEWVSVVSRVREEFYEYVNASIPKFDDPSDMWEISYIQTSDFIETTNVTWSSVASSGESVLSVKSYTMERDDSGEWRYVFSLNATVA